MQHNDFSLIALHQFSKTASVRKQANWFDAAGKAFASGGYGRAAAGGGGIGAAIGGLSEVAALHGVAKMAPEARAAASKAAAEAAARNAGGGVMSAADAQAVRMGKRIDAYGNRTGSLWDNLKSDPGGLLKDIAPRIGAGAAKGGALGAAAGLAGNAIGRKIGAHKASKYLVPGAIGAGVGGLALGSAMSR